MAGTGGDIEPRDRTDAIRRALEAIRRECPAKSDDSTSNTARAIIAVLEELGLLKYERRAAVSNERPPTRHVLKCWPISFEPLAAGLKTFDIRRNDRDFRVGDTLLLREYRPPHLSYTGRQVARVITYVYDTNHEHQPVCFDSQLVVLGLKEIAP